MTTRTYNINLDGVDVHQYLRNPVVTERYNEAVMPIGQATLSPDQKTVTVEFYQNEPTYNHSIGQTTATYAGGVKVLMGLSVIPVQSSSTKQPTKPKTGAKRRRSKASKKMGLRNNGIPKTTNRPSYGISGSPTKLTPALLKATQKYYKDKNKTKEMPYVEELAVYHLDVDRHMVSRWHHKGADKEWLAKQPTEKADLFSKFSALVKRLATMQLLRLKEKGIESGHNTVAIFLMKADHNMVETQRHELGGIGGKPIEYKPIEILSVKDLKAMKERQKKA